MINDNTTHQNLEIQNTARQNLEIQGSLYYLIGIMTMISISIGMQIISKYTISNILPMIFTYGIIFILSFILYRRKKNHKSVTLLSWIIGIYSVLLVSALKFKYAADLDWQYSTESYHVSATLCTFVLMLHYFYNKKLYLTAGAIAFTTWIIFLIMAQKNGVVFHV